MNWIQKILKAMGVEVTEEQAELIETAIDKNGKKEDTKDNNKDNKKNDNKVEDKADSKNDNKENEVIKALEAKLVALESVISAQKKESELESLLSDTKDKELVKMLLKEAENPAEALKGLKTSKPYLFNELPDVKGDDNQKLMDEFEREYRKEYLS